jgi:hypothetical protein
MRSHLAIGLLNRMLLLCLLLTFARSLSAQSNEVLGEVELIGATDVEKTSGVGVDGKYLGYLKELKGSKKILLLPWPTQHLRSAGRLPRLHREDHRSASGEADDLREDVKGPEVPDAVRFF